MRKKERKKIGVLFSGGLDSAALVARYLDLGYRVWPVFVRTGLPWEKEEIIACRNFLKALKNPRVANFSLGSLDLEQAYIGNWSSKGKIPSEKSADAAVFLPARNLLLITKSILLLSSKRVYDLALAVLKGNPFPDSKTSYLKKLESVLSGGFKNKIRIHAPFGEKSKTSIIKKFSHYPLHLTVSCLTPNRGIHCGRCNKCAERKKAFRLAGVEDRTIYKKDLRQTGSRRK